MKLIISPAKSLDFESTVPTTSFSQACFLEQAKIVHRSLVKKTPKQLTQLMNISEKLVVGTVDSKSKDFAGEIMSFIFLAFIFRRF